MATEGFMMDYAELLLNAINNYNDENAESKNHLRDVVCFISDNEQIKQDTFICKLLYLASQKMRVFGYNFQNKITSDPDKNARDISLLRNESIKKHYQSKVYSTNVLDKTQKEVIDFFQSLQTKRMLVSAPTSYGKTFIMREIVFLNKNRYRNILLVFPTVALLRENAINMEKMNHDLNLGFNIIKSIDSEIDMSAKNIFVFTPERAMQLLANFSSLKLDFFFYDEMYKIDEDFCHDEPDDETQEADNSIKKSEKSFWDEARAKTFRICLYLLSKQVSEYYLAGPNLNKDTFGKGMLEYLHRNNIQVKEITFEPTKRIRVDASKTKLKEDTSNISWYPELDSYKLSEKINEKICDIVNYIYERKYGQTLLYCTTPSKANEYSTKLATRYQGKKIHSLDFIEFLTHVKKTYDIDNSISQWSFVSVLEKGFAMHHGKLPKYIQKEVLDMFNDGLFDLLFCTSTIVEGVNTNAKNVVIINHTKGQAVLTPFDLKNIIGRAGRYYHNFIGRFYLVNVELLNIEMSENLRLDFATYNDIDLDGVDLDNADILDLSLLNQEEKNKRIEKQKSYKLPEDVFVKNRLIKKEHQEKLLNYLLQNYLDFESFFQHLKYPDILEQFITYSAIKPILTIFRNAELIEEWMEKKYNGISYGYCKDGFQGILKFEIMRAKENNKSIDNAYSNAFRTQKDIIEYKIPQMLSLFEAIFICAAKMKQRNVDNFSLSRVNRFYETGVRSYFGEQLIEYGFPIDTVRKIETSLPDIKKQGAESIQKFVNDNWEYIIPHLDKYEMRLLKKAMKSFN